MITIRAEDLRGVRPDVMAAQQHQLFETMRGRRRVEESDLIWRWRRNLALAYLAGYVPPTAAQRWWERYEDDALAYAEVYT